MKSHWSKHKLHILLFSVPCVLCSNACPEELCWHSTTVTAAPSPIQCTLGSSTITKTAAISLTAPSYPFKIWQRLDHLEEVDPLHMFTIILEHSRPPNNGNRGSTDGTLLYQREGYSSTVILYIKFKKTLNALYLTTLDLLLGSWSIYFISFQSSNLSEVIDIQRACHCLSPYFLMVLNISHTNMIHYKVIFNVFL